MEVGKPTVDFPHLHFLNFFFLSFCYFPLKLVLMSVDNLKSTFLLAHERLNFSHPCFLIYNTFEVQNQREETWKFKARFGNFLRSPLRFLLRSSFEQIS